MNIVYIVGTRPDKIKSIHDSQLQAESQCATLNDFISEISIEDILKSAYYPKQDQLPVPSTGDEPFIAPWQKITTTGTSIIIPKGPRVGEVIYYKFLTLMRPSNIIVMIQDAVTSPSAGAQPGPGKFNLRLFYGKQLIKISSGDTNSIVTSGDFMPGTYYLEIKNAGTKNAINFQGRIRGKSGRIDLRFN